MSLSLLITINVLADIALLGGLAYAMSHARRLKPHVAAIQPAQTLPAEQPLARPRERRPAQPARPDFARPRASVATRSGARGTAAQQSAS
jgi:hypothetical protein